jgi:hypothetical protein
MLDWMDHKRLIVLALAVILGALSVLLEQSGQYSLLSRAVTTSVPITLSVVIVARAFNDSRLGWGLLVAVPLMISAAVDLVISPARHPEITVFVLGTAALWVLVGWRVGMFSFGSSPSR